MGPLMSSRGLTTGTRSYFCATERIYGTPGSSPGETVEVAATFRLGFL